MGKNKRNCKIVIWVLSVFLVLVFVLGIFASYGHFLKEGREDGRIGYYTLSYSRDNTYRDITYSVKKMRGGGCVTIPERHNGIPVTMISIRAFYNCENLYSIVIPASVVRVDSDAFYGCTELTAVYYCGTEEDWNKITIYNGNNSLKNATRYYI